MRWLALVVVVAACGTPGPRPLGYDVESCAHCHMTLSDRRFGGEVILRTGRVIPFDDAGCLVTWLAGEGPPDVHSIWVSDFLPPHDLLRAEEAVFLVSEAIHTPMDYQIAALASGSRADSVRNALGGELVPWDRLRGIIQAREASR